MASLFLVFCRRRSWRLLGLLILCLLLAAAFGCGQLEEEGESGDASGGEGAGSSGPLEVHFIDVGQGDAVLIQAPFRNILIDGGDRGSGAVEYLNSLGVRHLDLVISTHPHADHIGGLIDVLETFTVGQIIDSGRVHTTRTYEDYLNLIDRKGIPFELGRAGDVLEVGPGITLKIVHPGPYIEDYCLNNASVVVKLVYGQAGFLFAGDAEEEAEMEILDRGYDLSRIDLLKVGHHGSRTSTSPAFLDALSPRAAVIQVGEGNPYGHPHQETLERLEDVDIYRTDLHGSIRVTTEGSRLEIDAAVPVYE